MALSPSPPPIVVAVVALIVLIAWPRSSHATPAATVVPYLPLPPLTCMSRADALYMVEHVVANDAAMRILLRGMSRDDVNDLVLRRLHLIQSDDDGGGGPAATTSSVRDTRSYFWPSAWRRGGYLIRYAANNATTATTVTNCTSLVAVNMNDVTSTAASYVPYEVVTLLYAIVVHEVFISERRVCDEQNEVTLYNEETNSYVCACANGDVTCSSANTDRVLLSTAVGLVCAVVVIMAAISIYMATQVKPRSPINARRGIL